MLYENVLRPGLWRVSANDAEIAHRLTIRSLAALERVPGALELIRSTQKIGEQEPVTLCGITFPNRLGLAAGCDKHAEALLALFALGFGHIEVGTILPRPQEGNPRPRLFRLPEDHSVINRMGFNSHGADTVAKRLARYRRLGPMPGPVGLSLGKMKTTDNAVASVDFIDVLRTLVLYGDYLAGNVSSPNTPELRELQGKAYLTALVRSIVEADRECRARLKLAPRPLFVKIAPDNMGRFALEQTLEAILEGGGSGVIVCNTTTERPESLVHPLKNEAGGLSGPRLFSTTLALVRKVRELHPEMPIIAVGGISSRLDVIKALRAGADLVQIYTGLVFQGPKLIRDILQAPL